MCPLSAEAAMMRQFYKNLIYPLLHAHQTVAVVPGFFGNCSATSISHCAYTPGLDCFANCTGDRCVCPEQDAANLAKLEGYLQWIRTDPLITSECPARTCDKLWR